MNRRLAKSLQKRAAIVRVQRMILCLSGLLLILVAVLSFSGRAGTVKARDTSKKYFTQIQIQPGDTLWDIADTYADGYESTQEFIHEVEEINHVDAGSITSGCYLMIPYYAEHPKHQ